MALTDEGNGSNMVMPVAPMYGSNGGGYGFGGDFGGWLILFLLFGMFNGGWGGGFGGMMWPMMMGGMNGGFGLDYLYPWLNNSQHISDGFRDQQLQSSVNGLQNSITSGFGDVQLGIAGVNQNICQTGNGIVNALNSGFANTNTTITGAQNAISQQMYNNEIANLNRSFAEQSANAQGFNGVNAGVADLRYTVATEACADRAAVGDALQNVTMQNMGNTNQIVNAINGGIQSIKDQLCQYRDDQKNETIANLRQELMYSRGQASQVEQTAQILANNNAQTALFQQGLNNEVDQLYSRLKNCPVGTVPVFGNQPIFTCPTNVNGGNGCGCGNSF